MAEGKTVRFNIILLIFICGIIAIYGNMVFAQQADSFHTDLLKKGEQSYLEGNYQEAIKKFEVASFGLYNEKNLLAIAKIYLCLCYYRLNDLEKCEKYLQDTEILVGEAGLESVVIHEEAREDLELILFYARPTDNQNPELEGKTLQEIEQEIQEFEEQIKEDTENMELYLDLYERYIEVKNYKNARKTIEKLLKIQPREIEGYYLIGVAHYKEGKYDDALDDFNRFFQHSANVQVENELLMNARAYLIISYYKNGDREKSVEVMGEAPDIYNINTVKTLPLDRNDKVLLLNILEVYRERD